MRLLLVEGQPEAEERRTLRRRPLTLARRARLPACLRIERHLVLEPLHLELKGGARFASVRELHREGTRAGVRSGRGCLGHLELTRDLLSSAVRVLQLARPPHRHGRRRGRP